MKSKGNSLRSGWIDGLQNGVPRFPNAIRSEESMSCDSKCVAALVFELRTVASVSKKHKN